MNTLYAGQATYIDWAVANIGTAAASGRVYNCLYLDGSEVGRWYVDNLGSNYYASVSDWSLTVATAGSHVLKLVADCTGAVSESNESDNVWQGTFTWVNPNGSGCGTTLAAFDQWLGGQTELRK